jgi:peroxiredoxin
MRTDSLYDLPKDLPVPQDDGACDHLTGMKLPAIALRSMHGGTVDLAGLGGTTVIYIYPRTGRPDQEVPPGWNEIPGARGCTPQSCAFRDHHEELKRAGAAQVFGLSTQDPAYQREAAERLHLPFELLSDAKLQLVTALKLPTFEVDGMKLIKRLTLIARDRQIAGTPRLEGAIWGARRGEPAIVKVFYPVFPPDRNASEVLAWLDIARRDG